MARTRQHRAHGARQAGLHHILRRAEQLAPPHAALPRQFEWRTQLDPAGARAALTGLTAQSLRPAEWQASDRLDGGQSRQRQITLEQTPSGAFRLVASPTWTPDPWKLNVESFAALEVTLRPWSRGVEVTVVPSEKRDESARRVRHIATGLVFLSTLIILLALLGPGRVPLGSLAALVLFIPAVSVYSARRRAALKWRPSEQLELIDAVRRALPPAQDGGSAPYRDG
ncbi:MAG: hypothetical protein B7733_21510 [Myxococcales bacterium FL481]|nr:MAG: hypothetical protein B7733_21510 [Myxococcales bacterium FL481]